MEALATRSKGNMTFLHASQIAREHGFCSCLLLPGDHLLFTLIESTYALFASCEEVGNVHCFSYRDLTAMDEQAVITSLEKASAPGTDVPQQRHSLNKAQF